MNTDGYGPGPLERHLAEMRALASRRAVGTTVGTMKRARGDGAPPVYGPAMAFRETVPAPTPTPTPTAIELIERAADRVRRADPRLTKAAAMTRALSEEPALYDHFLLQQAEQRERAEEAAR